MACGRAGRQPTPSTDKLQVPAILKHDHIGDSTSREPRQSVIEVNGGRCLRGVVEIGGSKQAALHLLGAILLADGEVTLRNAPNIKDVRDFLHVYASIGVRHRWSGRDLIIAVDPGRLDFGKLDASAAVLFRSSVLLLGSALIRAGRIRFPSPGGCRLGPRPLNKIASIVRLFGYRVDVDRSWIAAERHPRVADDPITVEIHGAGQNATALALIMAAGHNVRTDIVRPLRAPAITTLTAFLNRLGARMGFVHGTPERVHASSPGVERLASGDFEIAVGPDGPEMAFWIAAAGLTRGHIQVRCTDTHLKANYLGPLGEIHPNLLDPMGLPIRVVSNGVFEVDASADRTRPVEVRTSYDEMHGTSIDATPHFIPLLATARGCSYYEDIHYGPHRLMFAAELCKMGARITQRGLGIELRGVSQLRGATLEGHDIRSTACLVLSALRAEGVSQVHGFEHIGRAYSRLAEKLVTVGADVKIV